MQCRNCKYFKVSKLQRLKRAGIGRCSESREFIQDCIGYRAGESLVKLPYRNWEAKEEE